MRRKYRIINKRRFYLFLTSVFIIIAMIVLSLVSNNKVHSSYYEIEYVSIEVKEGDTLWNIASKYLTDYSDIRKAIYDIKALNKLDSSYIYPGDIIKIPSTNNNSHK